MKWKEEFQHGIIWQDFQHKQLVGNINALISSVTTGNIDEKTFRKTARFVVEYCNTHFKIEEAYMKSHGYPRTNAHVAQHNEFIKELNMLLHEDSADYSEKSSVLLNNLLKLFAEHILTTDKYFAQFLIKHKLV
ncbi:MAG: bacteriohemerythrin [Proteobacteria bacterium]|nr:bacteriohemerythrin [Pseudomonadota bacterium]MBU1686423.1 bacteriohemerythrin [Pseudomonadota bacterium]